MPRALKYRRILAEEKFVGCGPAELPCLGRWMVPIQIRSQFLRQWQPDGDVSAAGAFASMVEAPERCSGASEAHPPGHWRQRDVKRAIGAAEQAGLASYRVEVAPDGTISIIVGDLTDTSPDPDR